MNLKKDRFIWCCTNHKNRKCFDLLLLVCHCSYLKQWLKKLAGDLVIFSAKIWHEDWDNRSYQLKLLCFCMCLGGVFLDENLVCFHTMIICKTFFLFLLISAATRGTFISQFWIQSPEQMFLSIGLKLVSWFCNVILYYQTGYKYVGSNHIQICTPWMHYFGNVVW